MDHVNIRPIQQKDNPHIAKAIRSVLVEHDVPKVGTVYEDKELDCMFETYNVPKAAYFVVEYKGEIMGGAGVAPLSNFTGNVCELQKMYFLESLRGKGIGTRMMDACISKAIEFGYDSCYLETMPFMKGAQKLYIRTGFEYIDGPMGDTGHFSCPVHMLKHLS